jgi:hypothetical protein
VDSPGQLRDGIDDVLATIENHQVTLAVERDQ